MDYKEVGVLAVDVHYDYERAMDKYNEMLAESKDLSKRINKVNATKSKQEYEKLCEQYREIAAGIRANESYRQSLFVKLNAKIKEMLKNANGL